MEFREIKAESALNKLKRKIPYGWDLNIFRGCSHACQYCYAMYSHEYLGSDSFFSDIYVKTNIVDKLEKELSSASWKREIVNIGGVTDSYQPAEEKYRLMPEILKLMIKYKTPVIISTKSDLILRDYDLIDELSRLTYVNVAATITSMDEAVRQKVEPGSRPSADRFRMLKEFRKTDASIGVHVMPIIPYITDNESNFEKICSGAKDCGADYLLPGTLYLRGAARKHFFEFVGREFPDLYEKLKELYKTGGAGPEYKEQLYKMVNAQRDKYGISGNYTKPMRERLSR